MVTTITFQNADSIKTKTYADSKADIWQISLDSVKLGLTAFADNEVIKEAINEAGIYWYMNKPFAPDQMEQMIINALNAYHAENKLKESEEKFKGVFNSMSDVFTRSDSDGKCVMVSPSIYQLMGYKQEDLLGRNLADFYADPNQRIEIVNKLQKTKIVENFEIDVVRKDGKVITVSTNAKIYYNSKGEPLGVEGILRDITERKKVDEQNRKFNKIIETTSQSVIITNIKGTVLYVNPSYYAFSGFVEDEVIGKSMYRFAHKKGAIKLAKEVVPALIKKRHWQGDMTVVKKDKQIVPVDLVCSLLSDEKNKPEFFVALFSDITNRKQAEEALRESEEKFRTLVTKTEEIIFIIAKDGTFLLSEGNGLAKLGLKPGEVVGKSVFELYKDFPAMLGNMRQTFNGETVIMEHEVGENYFKSWYTPHSNQKGEIIGLLGLTVNITEQKKAELQVQEYQKRLKDLANKLILSEEKQRRQIATDLHDDVGQILASSRLQMAAINNTMDKQEMLDKINTISLGLREAIRTTRNVIFELNPPQLNEIGLVAAISDWVNKEIVEKYGIKIIISGYKRKLKLSNEVRYLLFRCVRELLINVIKHAGASQVDIQVQKNKKTLTISVKDNGSGFSYNPDMIKIKESGFGLFSILERLESIGGAMFIETAPGKGTKTVLNSPIEE